MIPDWRTDELYFSDLLRTTDKYQSTYGQLCKILQKHGIRYYLLQKTKDIWARDYMPIQVTMDRFLEYRYEPDYLRGTKKGEHILETYQETAKLGLNTLKTKIILDGGNVVRSENSVIMTDKVVQENKASFTRFQLIEELEALFETDKVVLIPWDRLEIYGHADGVLRFIDNETVLINWIYRNGDKNFKNRLLKPLKEKGINYEWMELKVKKITRYNWAYINFLQTSNLILVPSFGLSEDVTAFEQISTFYKSYANKDGIHVVESKSIAGRGGALNCISWSISN